MNSAKQTPVRHTAQKRRTVEARSILTRHFGFGKSDAEDYFDGAAERERRRVMEIEKAVIQLACDIH